MSGIGDIEVLFLTACEKGELQTIRELVQSKAVNPTTVIDKRRDHDIWLDPYCFDTNGWTPLHFAAA